MAAGLPGIGVGVADFVSNNRARGSEVGSRGWQVARTVTLPLGAIFAFATWPLTYFMGYPVPEGDAYGRVVGLPFMVAYFDSAGLDYVGGTITLLALAGNAIFWFLAPEIVLWLVRRRSREGSVV